LVHTTKFHHHGEAEGTRFFFGRRFWGGPAGRRGEAPLPAGIAFNAADQAAALELVEVRMVGAAGREASSLDFAGEIEKTCIAASPSLACRWLEPCSSADHRAETVTFPQQAGKEWRLTWGGARSEREALRHNDGQERESRKSRRGLDLR
jgi:hypothetical protein